MAASRQEVLKAQTMEIEIPPSHHVVLSGCSGGGKSTLLTERARQGFPTVCEPGRRIIDEELRGDGVALPWVDLAAFAKRAIDVAMLDRECAPERAGWTFFDRGLVDAAIALQYATGRLASVTLGPLPRYHVRVFMTPPWPEIYVTDTERRHGLDDAIAEYNRLVLGYDELGYEMVILHKTGIAERADFVLRNLE